MKTIWALISLSIVLFQNVQASLERAVAVPVPDVEAEPEAPNDGPVVNNQPDINVKQPEEESWWEHKTIYSTFESHMVLVVIAASVIVILLAICACRCRRKQVSYPGYSRNKLNGSEYDTETEDIENQ
eukprot:245853_1